MKIGDAVSDYKFNTTAGEDSFANHHGKYIVLFFYPKDMTPGCIIEARDFSFLQKEFAELNTIIFGTSRDKMSSHINFAAKASLTCPLIDDNELILCDLFAVLKEKSMFGKKYKGIDRSTFVINPEGKVVKEWRSVSAKGHAAEVLEFIKKL